MTSDVSNSKSTHFSDVSQDKTLSNSPQSEPLLGANKNNSASGSVAKVLTWDPWDKLSRKHKKDNKVIFINNF